MIIGLSPVISYQRHPTKDNIAKFGLSSAMRPDHLEPLEGPDESPNETPQEQRQPSPTSPETPFVTAPSSPVTLIPLRSPVISSFSLPLPDAPSLSGDTSSTNEITYIPPPLPEISKCLLPLSSTCSNASDGAVDLSTAAPETHPKKSPKLSPCMKSPSLPSASPMQTSSKPSTKLPSLPSSTSSLSSDSTSKPSEVSLNHSLQPLPSASICPSTCPSTYQTLDWGPSRPPSSPRPRTQATEVFGATDEGKGTKQTSGVEVIEGSKSHTATFTAPQTLDSGRPSYLPFHNPASPRTANTMSRGTAGSKSDPPTIKLSNLLRSSDDNPMPPEKSLTFHALWDHHEPAKPPPPPTIPWRDPSPEPESLGYKEIADIILSVHNHIREILADAEKFEDGMMKPIRPSFRRGIKEQLRDHQEVWKELEKLMGMVGKNSAVKMKVAVRKHWRKQVRTFVGVVVKGVLSHMEVVCKQLKAGGGLVRDDAEWRKQISVLQERGLEGELREVVENLRGLLDGVYEYFNWRGEMRDGLVMEEVCGRIEDKVREIREMWWRVDNEGGKVVEFNETGWKRDGRGRMYRKVTREDLLIAMLVVKSDQTWDLVKIIEEVYKHVNKVCLKLRETDTPVLIPEKRKLRERIQAMLRTNELMWLGQSEPWQQTSTVLGDLESLLDAIDRYREGNRALLKDGLIDPNVLCEKCGNIENVCAICGEIQVWWRKCWRTFRQKYPEKAWEMKQVDSCPGWIVERIRRRIEELESGSTGKSCDVTVV